MIIKYHDKILNLNNSKYCIDCAINDRIKPHRPCFGLCCKVKSENGFNIIDDCEIFEL